VRFVLIYVHEKLLGLTLSPALLATADVVIE